MSRPHRLGKAAQFGQAEQVRALLRQQSLGLANRKGRCVAVPVRSVLAIVPSEVYVLPPTILPPTVGLTNSRSSHRHSKHWTDSPRNKLVVADPMYFALRLLAARHRQDLFVNLRADLLDRTAFEHGASVDVHVVLHAVIHG